jgi:hypothetical protein
MRQEFGERGKEPLDPKKDRLIGALAILATILIYGSWFV